MQTDQKIPGFRAPASTGQTLAWDEAYQGKIPVVLVFLRDLDDRSIEQIEDFDRLLVDFGHERVQVLGVARATASEVREVVEEHGINLPILADAAGQIMSSFDATDADGSVRGVTVLADRHGTVVRVFDRSGPTGQAASVLELIRDLKDSTEYAMAPAVG